MAYNSKYKSSEIEEILDSVGGKQEKLVSGTNIKTINGTSILGSGDITIGGGGGGVYITPFTVEQFCNGYVELTDEQRDNLLNAASQNRIIGMPYEGHQTGYVIADYHYSLDDSLGDYIWSLELGIIYNSTYYSNTLNSQFNPNNFTPSRVVITPLEPTIHYVYVEDGVAEVSDALGFPDNSIYNVDGECTKLHIHLELSEIGKTVRFFTGESCTLVIGIPVYWANGEIPTIEPYTHYELALVANMEGVWNAVLIPFKPVE